MWHQALRVAAVRARDERQGQGERPSPCCWAAVDRACDAEPTGVRWNRHQLRSPSGGVLAAGEPTGGALAGTFLIDAHVHHYEASGPGPLDDAARSLAAAARDLHIVPAAGGLLFAEGAREHAFERLCTMRVALQGCTIDRPADALALLVSRRSGLPLILIAGGQVNSAGGPGFLALCTLAPVIPSRPLTAWMAEVLEARGLPILVWDPEKWCGARDRALARFLETTPSVPLFLGDTANPPAGRRPPRPFGPARRRGVLVLPGTDPLPGAAPTGGRYGFLLGDRIARERLAAGLVALLDGLDRQPPSLGRRAAARTLVGQQIAMQPRKRAHPAAPGRHGLAHDIETPDVETASAEYARRFGGPVGAWFLEVQGRLVLGLLPAAAGRPLRILEVGGGHGQLTEALLAAGHEVVVHGSALACATRVQSLRARYPRQLHFVASSLWTLPFTDRAFDAVIGIRLLAHVARYQSLLGEMARVSRRAVIVDFAPRVGANLLEPLLFRVKRRLERDTRPFFVHRPDSVMRPLAAAGYGRFRLEKQFFWPMVVHRTAGRRQLSQALELPPRALGLTRLLGGPALLAAERIEEAPQ